MSLDIEWTNEQKTVILITFNGPWTWQAFDAGADAAMKLASSVDHTVDVIVDARAHPNPPDANAMPHFQRIRRIQPSNSGGMAVVGAGSFMQWIMNTVGNVLGWPGGMPRFHNSLEEAEAFLAERRALNRTLLNERAS